jgi:pyocin large subunit-like protein
MNRRRCNPPIDADRRKVAVSPSRKPLTTLWTCISGSDLVRFDPATGNFGVLSPQGAIRTFFRPDDDVAYFLRQFK